MILQRTTGGGGGMLVCLRCYLKIAAAGAGRSARRGVSNVATSRPVGGGEVRLQPFFDRSGPGLVGSSSIGSSRGRILRGSGGGSGGLGGLGETIKGGFFFGNERLFVGGRRWLGGVGVGVSANATTTAEVNGSANVTGIGVSSPSGPGIKSKEREEGLQEILQSLPPHRRRQYLKSHQQQPQVQLHPQTHQSSTTFAPPPDASSILTTAASSASKQSLKRLFFTYLSLTKPRLTFLIVLSAACSYALFPLPPLLSETPSLSTLTLLYLTIGTSLCSASANTLNMYLEPQYDAQMSRTRNRPLARGLLTGRQAVIFAIVTGTAGTLALWFGVNPTVAGLGALNIVLYAGVYTPLKRINVVNTWVGAVVGGIPPLMGWAAAAGGTSTTTPSSFFSSSSSSSSDHAPAEKWYTEPYHLLSHPGGWLLFSLLFAWQFPHFAALSTTIAQEYRQAGYQMMAWKYPQLNARVALRYSILTFPICFGLTYVGVTDKGFLLTSSLVNAWLVREAWRFWKYTGGKGSARGLFWASVWHLPVVMVLAMVHKEGLWRGVWRGVKKWVKGGEEDEEEEWDGEEGYVY